MALRLGYVGLSTFTYLECVIVLSLEYDNSINGGTV